MKKHVIFPYELLGEIQQNESFVAHYVTEHGKGNLIDIPNPHNAYHNPEMTHFNFYNCGTLQNI